MSDHTNPVFADRHIGPDSAAVTAMLEVIGVDSLEELARRARLNLFQSGKEIFASNLQRFELRGHGSAGFKREGS